MTVNCPGGAVVAAFAPFGAVWSDEWMNVPRSNRHQDVETAGHRGTGDPPSRGSTAQLPAEPLPDRAEMSSRMCDRASSPFACVEFSVHCWVCGEDRIGMS